YLCLYTHAVLFVYMSTLRPPPSTLFPYTTLFRSDARHVDADDEHAQPLAGIAQHRGGHVQRRLLLRGVRVGFVIEADLRQEHLKIGRATSELQSRVDLVCRLLLEKKK